ncbi:hypothetical protein CRUP_021713, partial [Coryphaenoides rupestris]
MLKFSKDGKNWKLYKAAQSKERKVFEAHADGYLRVMNSLIPPVVARFIQLHPLTWKNQASAQVQVLGCPAPRVTSRTSSASDIPAVHVNTNTTVTTAPPRTVPTGDTVLVKDTGSSRAVEVGLAVVLGLLACGCCLLAGLWWKR